MNNQELKLRRALTKQTTRLLDQKTTAEKKRREAKNFAEKLNEAFRCIYWNKQVTPITEPSFLGESAEPA